MGEYTPYIIIFITGLLFFIILGFYLRRQKQKEITDQRKQEALQAEKIATSTTQQPSMDLSFISRQPDMRRLQLQAYERLIILCDRLSFHALLARLPVNASSTKELRQLLIQTIQSEFEYNLSQQIYVSHQAWDAIKNLKEQQIFIIHQLAEQLPADAKGIDLAANITTLLSHNEHATLHPIVAAHLNNEAKLLIQAV